MRRRPLGPLALWRLPAAVATAAATTGTDLLDELGRRGDVDLVLARALGVGAVTWIVLGRIDRVLATVDHEVPAGAEQDPSTGEPVLDDAT